MRISDIIDEVLRERGWTEDDILIGRSTAFARYCPTPSDQDDKNSKVPDEIVDEAKKFIRLTLDRIAVDPEYLRDLIKEAGAEVGRN